MAHNDISCKILLVSLSVSEGELLDSRTTGAFWLNLCSRGSEITSGTEVLSVISSLQPAAKAAAGYRKGLEVLGIIARALRHPALGHSGIEITFSPVSKQRSLQVNTLNP